jgi:outer membrane protein TolC
MRRSLFIVLALPLAAQSTSWTLDEVVHRAGEKYPSVTASLERAAAAAGGVLQARLAYRPRGEFLAQVNRATRNNVFGMLLPNSVVAPISGPPLATNAGTNVWGSATGLAVQWEPFDLGLRAARVATADAGRIRAEQAIARTRFEAEAAAADAYLTVLAAEQLVESANASVERARTFRDVVKALTAAELKPGADLARAEAELASALGQQIQARQAVALARAALAQYAGEEAVTAMLQPENLSRPYSGVTAGAAANHPALEEQRAAVAESLARRKELDYAWRPRFQVQSALYARGTGANPDGSTLTGANGLAPNIYNWGLGFSVTFPFLDKPHVNAQRDIETHRNLAEAARLKEVERELATGASRAQASFQAARELETTLPAQLEAARAAERQSRARYQAGLATVLEVADAQRLLAQSEADSALARLNVWRARLALDTARGDLNAFLTQVKSTPGAIR